MPVFHHSIRDKAPNLIPLVFGKAPKKQNADIKAESCLLFSGTKTQYFEGLRNRQVRRTLFHIQVTLRKKILKFCLLNYGKNEK